MPRERANFDYQALAEFRYQIRRFVSFSQKTARAVGVDPQQHQLLLAVRGLPQGMKPTIRTLAERLQIQHHSTVELIDRSEERGLVQRQRDGTDRRQVSIHLTPKGERILAEIAQLNRNELQTAGRELVRVLRTLIGSTRSRRAGERTGAKAVVRGRKRKGAATG